MSLDVVSARVAFRERGLSDVFDLALRFVVVHARAFGGLALVVILPALLLALAASRLGWTVAWAVVLTLAAFAQAPFTVLASRLVFEDDVRIRDVLVSTLRELPRLVVARIAWAAVMFVGVLLLVVPALWIAGVVVFFHEVMLLERARLVDAVGRSQRIAASSYGEAFLALLLSWLLVGAAVLLAEFGGRSLISDLLQFRPPPSLFTEGGSVLAFIGLFASVPYLATARFFTYLNVRTRSEGWEIQTRFAAIALRAPGNDR